MQEDIVWPRLSARGISEKSSSQRTPACRQTVTDSLDMPGSAKRKAQKKFSMGASHFRHEQFENTARLKDEYLDSQSPIIPREHSFFLHLTRACRGLIFTPSRSSSTPSSEDGRAQG